jgi:two-component system nitrate/nitrite response regulator NarL
VREQQVAQLAAEGLSNKRIARTLQLSDGTVKIHMHHVLSKLGLSGREALAARLPEPLLNTPSSDWQAK